MDRRALMLLVPLAAACGGSTTTDAITTTHGSAGFTVKSIVPSTTSGTGATFSLEASFVLPGEASCATTKIGVCTVTPCFSSLIVAKNGATNAGKVSLTSSASPGTIEPGSDDIYSKQTFDGAPWMSSGESITLAWEHFPGSTTESGSSLVVQTPSYVTLSPQSPFASPTSSLARTSDLTLVWTAATPPASEDEIAVSLISGSTQVDCIFDSTSGTATIPAAALENLPAGTGTFDIHSKRFVHQNMTAADGSSWAFSFNVDAMARTSDGVASGSVTYE